MAKLTVLSEGFNGLSFEVKSEKASIGRLEDNAFSISEPSVSSHHCEVWLKGDDVVVKDLGSTNGSFINELQLAAEKEAVLRPGQTLRLGQVQLRFETGLKQSEASRQTVRIGAGATGAAGQTAAFSKKSNNANKVFFAAGGLLLLIIIAALVYAFGNLASGPTS
jgi:pSer/pThr/pTyr-binding forkhead associated (FHA) protein